MKYFSRQQIIQVLEIDERFMSSLEQEEIIVGDAPEGAPGEFSEQMLERVRVVHNLVVELDVNLAGAAIIVRMRENMARMRAEMETLLRELDQLRR